MADDFFGKFAEAVSEATKEIEAEAPATETTQTAPSSGLTPAVWVGGLVVIAVVVLIIVLM